MNPLLPQNPANGTVDSFCYSQAHVRAPIDHPDIVEAVETMQRDISTDVFNRIRNAG